MHAIDQVMKAFKLITVIVAGCDWTIVLFAHHSEDLTYLLLEHGDALDETSKVILFVSVKLSVELLQSVFQIVDLLLEHALDAIISLGGVLSQVSHGVHQLLVVSLHLKFLSELVNG